MKLMFGKVIALAAVAAIAWMAVAVQLAAQSVCGGPTVALVKPFGRALSASAELSGS